MRSLRSLFALALLASSGPALAAAQSVRSVAVATSALSTIPGRSALSPVDTPVSPPFPVDAVVTLPPGSPPGGPVPPETGADTLVTPVAPTLPAELPVPTDAVQTGRIFRPVDMSALKVAVRQAVGGDVIELVRGRRYVGALFLPPRRGTGYVTVRTAGALPAPGTRADSAAAVPFAKLVAFGRNDPIVTAPNGSGGWRFVGVEFTVADSVRALTSLVLLGNNTARTLAEIPADFVFDRVYVHGTAALDMARGIAMNSARTAVVHSTVEEVHSRGYDATALGGWAGPGPFRIENNSLSGSGMGVFFGGSDPLIRNLTPSDIVVRGNRIWKPKAWKGAGWNVKNLVEFKLGRRVLIEGNVVESTWPASQVGYAFVIKSTNQDGGAPWSQTADLTIRYNVVRDTPYGLGINAHPESHPVVPTARVLVHDNLFYAIGTGGGRLVQLGEELSDVRLVRNTFLHAPGTGSQAVIAYLRDGRRMRRIALDSNVWTPGEYGWFADGGAIGTAALTAIAGTRWSAAGNVFAGPLPLARYPAGTRSVADLAALGFTALGVGSLATDPAAFTLAATSPYRGIGADMAKVLAATAAARGMR